MKTDVEKCASALKEANDLR